MDGKDPALDRVKALRLAALAILILAVAGAGLLAWSSYRRYRTRYDDYRARIQSGVTIAGLPVGGLTPAEARAKVTETIVTPYNRAFTLLYEDQPLTLSPADDLALDIPVDDLIGEATTASHQYDYWPGFWRWLKGSVETLNLDIPLRLSHDGEAAASFMARVAASRDLRPVEPMVDMQNLAFIPGKPGRYLDVEAAAALVNAQVNDPQSREISLPVLIVEPDQSPERIEPMISTLGPVLERAPGPPSFYTATLPVSTTGGLEGTPRITYTGELTWTFPHFAGYDGPLTTTYAYFFEPGEPGLTFDVDKAIRQVQAALRAGVTTPITFEPDYVPPPTLPASLLIPPLKDRLAQFPGVTSILVKNLDTGQVIYNSNTSYVLSGMSIAKMGIMVEVYNYYNGKVGPQTHQELLDMMGSSSCNPCANRLMATMGGGSSTAGAQRVTASMHRLGLPNFRLCGPFQVVDHWDSEQQLTSRELDPRQAAHLPYAQVAAIDWWPAPIHAEMPRYDRCVKATPAEMGKLLEMISQCTQNRGTLRQVYPKISPQACQEMIDIMAANDLRNMLGAGIPAEVKLAHKHGFSGYAVPWGDTRGEVGLVFSPGATYLVSFYIWQDTDWINWGINQPLYRDVSDMLYNFLNPDQPFWPEPPWAPNPEPAPTPTPEPTPEPAPEPTATPAPEPTNVP